MAPARWRKFAFALLTLAYFLYFNWNGLWARFAADDMMNMVGCWRLSPARLLLDGLLPWHGAYRSTRVLTGKRLSEIYNGNNARFRGELIRTIYFEREYLPGIASDKLPLEKYTRPGYGLKLAALLGRAALIRTAAGSARFQSRRSPAQPICRQAKCFRPTADAFGRKTDSATTSNDWAWRNVGRGRRNRCCGRSKSR